MGFGIWAEAGEQRPPSGVCLFHFGKKDSMAEMVHLIYYGKQKNEIGFCFIWFGFW